MSVALSDPNHYFFELMPDELMVMLFDRIALDLKKLTPKEMVHEVGNLRLVSKRFRQFSEEMMGKVPELIFCVETVFFKYFPENLVEAKKLLFERVSPQARPITCTVIFLRSINARNLETMQFLVQSGYIPKRAAGSSGAALPFLHVAVREGFKAGAQLLLEHPNVDATEKNAAGSTAAEYAGKLGKAEMVALFRPET